MTKFGLSLKTGLLLHITIEILSTPLLFLCSDRLSNLEKDLKSSKGEFKYYMRSLDGQALL